MKSSLLENMTSVEKQELSQFVGATHNSYPAQQSVGFHDIFNRVDRLVELAEKEKVFDISHNGPELVTLSILLFKHIWSVWGNYSMPRSAWHGRMSKKLISNLEESLDLVFLSNGNDNVDQEENALFETERLGSTRDAFLTLAFMLSWDTFLDITMRQLDAGKRSAFNRVLDDVFEHWASMSSIITAEEYGELDAKNNNVGPLYLSNKEDMTFAVLWSFEKLFEDELLDREIDVLEDEDDVVEAVEVITTDAASSAVSASEASP